jgi:hypothetical protein
MPAKSTRDRASGKSREELLADIAGLPSSAFISTAYAAAYLGSTPRVDAELAITTKRAALPRQKRLCPLSDFRSRLVDVIPL